MKRLIFYSDPSLKQLALSPNPGGIVQGRMRFAIDAQVRDISIQRVNGVVLGTTVLIADDTQYNYFYLNKSIPIEIFPSLPPVSYALPLAAIKIRPGSEVFYNFVTELATVPSPLIDTTAHLIMDWPKGSPKEFGEGSFWQKFHQTSNLFYARFNVEMSIGQSTLTQQYRLGKHTIIDKLIRSSTPFLRDHYFDMRSSSDALSLGFTSGPVLANHMFMTQSVVSRSSLPGGYYVAPNDVLSVTFSRLDASATFSNVAIIGGRQWS